MLLSNTTSAFVCTSTKLNDNYRFNHLSFLILNLSSVVHKYSNVLLNNMFDCVNIREKKNRVFRGKEKSLFLHLSRTDFIPD
jgi:hypothetical protein